MPRNASGTYSLPESAFVAGTTIQSAPVNSNFSDIASTLTLSLATTGVSIMTGPFKAASGSVTAPSITFSGATGTGFYLSGTDQFSWTAAGVLAATFASTGIVTWVAAQVFSSATITAATITTLTVSGAATVGTTLGVTGAAAFSSTVGITGTATVANLTNSIMTLASAGYVDAIEISAPSAPAVNTVRLYAVDPDMLAYKNSAGTVTLLTPPASTYTSSASTIANPSDIPNDGTVPLVSEGEQALAASAITLKKADSRVRLHFSCGVSLSELDEATAVIFRDSTCIAAKRVENQDAGIPLVLSLDVMAQDTPGSVGPFTYTVRVGSTGGGVTFQGGQEFSTAGIMTLSVDEIFV